MQKYQLKSCAKICKTMPKYGKQIQAKNTDISKTNKGKNMCKIFQTCNIYEILYQKLEKYIAGKLKNMPKSCKNICKKYVIKRQKHAKKN